MRPRLSPLLVMVMIVVASAVRTAGHEQATPIPVVGREGGDAASPNDSGPKDFAEWRHLVVEELVRHRRFPPGSARRNEHGVATVSFRVDRTGNVIEQKLVKSSGFFELDQEALELVKRAKFPPFATTMTESDLQLSVPINFNADAASKIVQPLTRLHYLLAASTAFFISAVLLALVFGLA